MLKAEVVIVIGMGTGNLARCRVGYSRVGVRVGFFPPGHYPYPKPRYRQVFSFFSLQKCADQELQIIQGIMVLTLWSHSEIVLPPAPHQVCPLLHCESSFAQNNETAVTQSDSVSLLPAEGICSQVLVIPSLLT